MFWKYFGHFQIFRDDFFVNIIFISEKKLSKDLHDLPVHYTHNTNAWMTKDVFQDWFPNCFLCEIGPIRDEKVPIQFLVDNCSAHSADILKIQDPDVTIKFYLPTQLHLYSQWTRLYSIL